MRPSFTPDSPKIAWTRHGDQGPPVLLIMGMGMRGHVWKPQVERLEGDHRLITFDNRGVGDSEEAPGWWTMEDMADDARRVLDAAGWETAHVVGVSMGGMVAQHLALRAPERLRSLTLIATHAGGPPAWIPPWRGLRGFLEVNLLPPEERFHALAYLLYPADFLRVADRETMVARMRDQLGSRPSASVRKKQLGAVLRHDTRARLAEIATPSLIVCSAEDALVDPREQERLTRRMPRAEVVRYDRAGHGLIFQCAGPLAAALRRWFSRHEPRDVSVSAETRH
ncbi:MAG TPA: alpha/beta hydrolase [Sandaracinaceae bacterium LLY-WYZ-13_1]|nr:alpha/beta hydrolase [Sandaracinaceae bacterium LLY-WYZ-13_1]